MRTFEPARRGGIVFFLSVALAVSCPAAIWIVDANNGPGTNFTTISAAVAAASPGDRILVRAGNYFENVAVTSGITIVGWNATQYPMIVPSNPSLAAIHGQVSVQNVPAGQTAVLSGLVILRPGTASDLCFGAAGCVGNLVLDRMVLANGGAVIAACANVIIEEMRIRHQPGGLPPIPGMSVYNSRIQGNDLDIAGGDLYGEPNFFPVAGDAMLILDQSVVCLARPKLIGGSGGGPWTTSASTPAGGAAIRALNGSIVSIVDDPTNTSYVVGGQGGRRGVGSSTTIPSGNGGNAADISGFSTVLNKKPMPFIPGPAGQNQAGGPVGSNGSPAFTTGGGIYGPIVDTPATFRWLGSTQPGGVLVMSHLAAQAGYPVGLALVTEFGLSIYAPSLQFMSGNPAAAAFLTTGVADANRYFQVGFTLPAQFNGIEGGSVLVQAADDVTGYLFLANPGVLVLGF